MNNKLIMLIFNLVLYVASIVIIGTLDGYWDALGLFLFVWANNMAQDDRVEKKLVDIRSNVTRIINCLEAIVLPGGKL